MLIIHVWGSKLVDDLLLLHQNLFISFVTFQWSLCWNLTLERKNTLNWQYVGQGGEV